MSDYTEEQVDCLLAEIEDRVDLGKYEGDDENIYYADTYVRDEIMGILREVKSEKDLIIKRKLPE
ncbi:hypothetical protein LCGC14_3072470 [marine sediment metagenome]|uniref:Uncharacterized protein n=1 Tax=marine sediment metagenome TaxID=412755 RepID=A0A0F8WGC3_9ZZZZ